MGEARGKAEPRAAPEDEDVKRHGGDVTALHAGGMSSGVVNKQLSSAPSVFCPAPDFHSTTAEDFLDTLCLRILVDSLLVYIFLKTPILTLLWG